MQELERYPNNVMEELEFRLRDHMQIQDKGNERKAAVADLQDWFADKDCVCACSFRYECCEFYLDGRMRWLEIDS